LLGFVDVNNNNPHMLILHDLELDLQAKQHMALLCLGEIGRRKDLSNHAHIENIVIESFQSPFEEIKSAASYALGNIAVGNLSKYLPFILDQIDNQQKKQYLLLHSLKEVSCYWNLNCKMCTHLTAA
jgi:cullin-associated NEDD8-dissociated protein 1